MIAETRKLVCAYNKRAGFKKVAQSLSEHMEESEPSQPGEKCREIEEWNQKLQADIEKGER